MRSSRVVALVLIGAMLAGCSGGEADEPADPLSSSTPSSSDATPADDPSSDVPELPDVAQENTLAGAEAFIRHYIELLNYASHTGDTDALEAVSDQDCAGCSHYADLYKETYSRGGFYKKGEWVTQKQVFSQRLEDGTVRLIAIVDTKKLIYRKDASSSAKTYGSEQYSFTCDVSWTSQRWSVLGFEGNET